MEEIAAYGIGALALIAALAVQAHVGVRGAKRGNCTVVVWAKSGCAGGVTMIGVFGVLFAIGKLVHWIGT